MQRIDKWLWCARFMKSRTLAASIVSGGQIRINGERCGKPSHMLKSGDVLTIAFGPHVRIVRAIASAERRGPAAEARALYDDLTPPEVKPAATPLSRPRGTGRPTKRDRRKIMALTGEEGLE
jgi:ribosome-associated heat shock protein Hsp15